MCDTGAAVSCVSQEFLEHAGLMGLVRPHSADGVVRQLRLPDRTAYVSAGVVDLEFMVQLMLDVSEGDAPLYVHWDRRILLKGVWVMPFPTGSGLRDMYVSYKDWGFGKGFKNRGPLGDLAYMVMNGAKLAAQPRAPRVDEKDVQHVVLQTGESEAPTLATVAVDGGGVAERHPENMTDEELRAALMEQVAPAQRNTEFAKTLVDSLVARRKIFNRLDVSETTVVVDMKMIGTPKPVSFKVPIRRGAQGNAATEGLLKWVAAGVARQVPWDTPAYGFAIVVPKADGRWRVTINPTETNRVTERIEISGGYMADSMVREAQRAGRGARWAALLDFAEAFTSLKLGPTAQAMSVFTTPIGKVQWLQGYFGWHSFPPAFQRAMMEKVILPAESAVQAAVLLAWIDDVFCGADSPMAFLAALHHVIDNALAVGWRLSLKKCLFLHDVFDWCGVEIDVENSQWRVSKDRVKSLTDTPLPKDGTRY